MRTCGRICRLARRTRGWRCDFTYLAYDGLSAPGAQGFAYHAWLEYGGHVIDVTTYQLPRKAQDLDAADGGTTQVEWAPDCLILPKHRVKTYAQVAASLVSGVAYYERDMRLLSKLGEGFQLAPEDLAMARLLMVNPDLQAIGPNQIGGVD